MRPSSGCTRSTNRAIRTTLNGSSILLDSLPLCSDSRKRTWTSSPASGAANDQFSRTAANLEKSLVVGRRAVDRRHGAIVQPQIHGELTAMVREVIHRVAQYDVTTLV